MTKPAKPAKNPRRLHGTVQAAGIFLKYGGSKAAGRKGAVHSSASTARRAFCRRASSWMPTAYNAALR